MSRQEQAMTRPLHVVIFGASGDLTARKLIPALLRLHRKGRLPAKTRIVGISRRAMANEELRRQLEDAAKKYSPEFDPAAWAKFAPLIEYVAADASTRQGLQPLFDW